MKIKTYILAVPIVMALSGLAMAAQPMNQPSAVQARSGGNTPPTESTDEAPLAWQVARYPSRVGHSVLRSPMMIGEALTGQRTFVNERGQFETPGQSKDSDPRNSIVLGRGQRVPR